ncbi:MAG TPA: hypothetical protein VJ276_01905 [Thermoanaerobaculia bacterium]|nr:hypothetical protein [Thermoanaerobaculia bacterium]
MTQFVLCEPLRTPVAEGVELQSIGDEPWLIAPAEALFPRPATVRVPVLAGGASIDDLFTEAHNVVFNGGDFESTRLGIVLPQMADRCELLAVWWASDWADLPLARTPDELMRTVLEQLHGPVGEVYVRWQHP